MNIARGDGLDTAAIAYDQAGRHNQKIRVDCSEVGILGVMYSIGYSWVD